MTYPVDHSGNTPRVPLPARVWNVDSVNGVRSVAKVARETSCKLVDNVAREWRTITAGGFAGEIACALFDS